MPEQSVTLVGLVKFSIRSPHKSLREIAGAIGGAVSANLKAAFRETAALQDEIVIRSPAELHGDLAANASAAAAAVQAAAATDSRTAELANHAVGLVRPERNARGTDRHAQGSTPS